MSRIDELIAELCPEGVEYKAFGEIGEIMRGKRFVKSDIVETGTPCIHYGEVYTKYGAWATEAFSYLSPELASRLRQASPGDVIFVSAGETIEDIGKAVAWLGNENVVTHDALYSFRSPLDPKYVAYFSQTDYFHNQIRRHISSAKISSISTQNLEKVRIPVPPLEVQREIVKVLDTFTQLEAELEAELEARRRQYQYYRDALLTFGERKELTQQARITTLGEIGSFLRGTGIQKSDFTETGVGCIHYGQIHTHYGTWADETLSFVSSEFAARLRKAHTGDLVIATTSEDDEAVAKAVAWLGDDDVAVSTDAYIFRHTLNPKYVSYFFQTESFQSQKKHRITGTKVRRISGESLAKIQIPVPSDEEQERVVSILDKFDALVNDLSTGLPAELKARRQQYEYYRDRLLTFKEVA